MSLASSTRRMERKGCSLGAHGPDARRPTAIDNYVSRMIVTGPSLTSSSSMRAPKTPRDTPTPWASRASQNAS
jgi:hypothetical protein